MSAGEKIFRYRISLIVIGVFAMGLAACDPKPEAGKDPDSSIVQKPAATGANGKDGSAGVSQSVDDLALNIKVEDALKEKPELKSLAVKVSTAGGVVTLSGTADTTANRDLATQIVMSLNGVKSVQNKIAVAGS